MSPIFLYPHSNQMLFYLERSFHAGQFMQSVFRLYRIGSDPDLPVKNIHVLSAPSPAATACLAIGETIACKFLNMTS